MLCNKCLDSAYVRKRECVCAYVTEEECECRNVKTVVGRFFWRNEWKNINGEWYNRK